MDDMSSDDVTTDYARLARLSCPHAPGWVDWNWPTSRDFLQEQGSFRAIYQASGPRRTGKIFDCFCLYRRDAILGKPL